MFETVTLKFGSNNKHFRTVNEKNRSQNIHDQNANVVTMLCTLTAKLIATGEKRTSSENQAATCLLVAYELKKVTDGRVQLVFSFSILFPLLN